MGIRSTLGGFSASKSVSVSPPLQEQELTKTTRMHMLETKFCQILALVNALPMQALYTVRRALRHESIVNPSQQELADVPEEEAASGEQCSFVTGSGGEALGGNGLPELTAPPRKRKKGPGSRASSESRQGKPGPGALPPIGAQSSSGSPATFTGDRLHADDFFYAEYSTDLFFVWLRRRDVPLVRSVGWLPSLLPQTCIYCYRPPNPRAYLTG